MPSPTFHAVDTLGTRAVLIDGEGNYTLDLTPNAQFAEPGILIMGSVNIVIFDAGTEPSLQDFAEWFVQSAFPGSPRLSSLASSAQAAIEELNRKAEGDSNDAEIEAGREVADILQQYINITTKGA